jgi:DNA helicase-2/ATP-dependent DNA helicase PcrA
LSVSAKELELADEQTAQKRYSQELQARHQKPRPLEGPRNNLWTGTGMPAPRVVPGDHLIGRVALASPDPALAGGSDFYIGETYANFDRIYVYSWAAPVACTFFRGTRHHQWCDEVTTIRAFVQRGGKIVDFAEEAICEDVPMPPFRKQGLSIPAATGGPRRPLPRPAAEPTLLPEPGAEIPTASMPASPAGGRMQTTPPLRAVALLRAQLQAPRTKSLAPVLSTLQPDQYDLVTMPAMGSATIIEGQPGTGKTIIASHRAAYLINEETPRDHTLDGDILLVGPTDGYTRHVRDVVTRLTGGTGRIKILALPQLMKSILGLKNEPRGPVSREWQDVDWNLGMLARKAIYHLKSLNGVKVIPEGAYELLRQNGVPGHRIATDPDWVTYLKRLPAYKDALGLRAHTPLLAFIKWEMAKADELRSIEHIIVDEAQDVTPLEWLLLSAINQTQDAWTILGDLNQRRSDHTLASWQQVREVLGLYEKEAPVKKLQRGYRSTKPILDYANRLLPSRERSLLAFQTEGPAPSVSQVPASGLGTTVVGQVDRLLGAYPGGTLAVLSVDPVAVRASLRSVGWAAASAGSQTWERGGRSVTVMHPDAARGLEFDAVIVVEPGDFPKNFGRQGPLYTALTRPNRELAIVHSKPLPDELRRR